MHLVSAALESYVEKYSSREDAVLSELTRETHLKVQMPQMVSGHVQGLALEFIAQLIQPKRILEIGTYTGYSAICMAKGLTADGILHTIDINEELQPMCARYFAKAGLSDKIVHHIGDARQIIPTLNETFDMVFIDADKANYSMYYDLVFDKVRNGGLIIADNVLWSGKVVDEKKDKDTLAIHRYNEKVATDTRVKSFILTLRDGLNIVRKTG
jgi:predicted O-methyltransferase YrrM